MRRRKDGYFQNGQHPGTVYLARLGPFYKIGFTVRLQERLRDINRGSSAHYEFVKSLRNSGQQLRLVHSFSVCHAGKVERALLVLFTNKNCHNPNSSRNPTTEWFRLSRSDVKWFRGLTSADESVLTNLFQRTQHRRKK